MRANNNPRRRAFQHHRPATSIFCVRNLAIVVFVGMILALYIMVFSYGPHEGMEFKGGGDKGPGAQLAAAGAGKKRGDAALVETEYNQDPPFHVVFSTVRRANDLCGCRPPQFEKARLGVRYALALES